MNNHCGFYLFIVLFSFVLFQYADAQEVCNTADDEKLTLGKLLDQEILCNYNKALRPVLQHTTPINITSEMVILNVHSVYEGAAIDTITMNLELTLSWRDEFLIWDTNLYGGIQEISLESSRIWHPRLSTINSEADQTSTFSEACTVKYTGDVRCTGEFSFGTLCDMTFKNWPYDQHKCTVELGMWMLKDEDVNVKFADSKFSVSPTFESTNWKFTNTEVVNNDDILYYTMFPAILINFSLQRTPNFIKVLQIFVMPVFFTLLATVVSISTDINSLGRMLATLLNVNFHMDLLSSVARKLSGNEEEVATAVMYIRQSFMIACAIMVHLVIVRYFASKRTQPPSWIVTAIGTMDSGVGKVVMFRELDTSVFSSSFLEDFENLTESEAKPTINEEWNRFAHILNRVFGICVCLSYFFMLLQFAF